MSIEFDNRIISLLNRLTESVSEEIRKNGPEAVFSDNFKRDLLKKAVEVNSGPLTETFFEKLFTEIISKSVSLTSPVKVSFLGPAGTFSNTALDDFFGKSVDYIPCKTIQDVFRDVEKSRSNYGVVPVENSTEGSVNYTLDELMETELYIIAERYIQITFALLTKGKDLSGVKRLYTHPQPAGQAKGWIRSNIPEAEIVYVDSTVKAAEAAAEDPGAAALASEHAAERLGLEIAAKGVEDLRHNYTRFCIISKEPAQPTDNDKTSIVCSVKDRPGALLGILSPLSDAGINMTRIESRPDKKKMWRYNFFIDFMGNQNDAVVQQALEEMRHSTIFLKILGSYPAGNSGV